MEQPRHVSPKTDFRTWLDRLSQEYYSLSSEEKTLTLDKLISSGEPDQLNFLSELLPQLLFRDFITLLPREVISHILSYLPVKTLLTCCTVSHAWNSVVNQMAWVWWLKARQVGATDVAFYSNSKASWKYRTLCLKVMEILDNCNHGNCFNEHYLEGHQNRVMAICYQDGRIATGSDDQSVRVWDAHTGRSLYKLQTHTVCDIKLTSGHVYTASFDGTAACWELSTGALRQHYIGHTSAVFSIDVHDTGLVITGSSDKSVKVWTKGGTLLCTMGDCHADWVTKVQFLAMTVKSEDIYFGSVDKAVCHIWSTDGTNCKMVNSTKKRSSVQITSFFHGSPGVFYMCTWKDKELCNSLVAYSFTSDKLNLMWSIMLAGDTPLRCHLLGAGCKFAALTSSSDINKVFIFNFNQSQCVAKIHVSSCRSTRNGATLTLGDTSWLDGFDGTAPGGTLLAACLQNSSQVLLVNWKH